MHKAFRDLIRSLSLLLLMCACYPCATAYGQGARLDLSLFNGLEAKASESVDITLDEKMLKLAAKFLSKSKNTDAAKLRDLIAALKGIYVKVYSFEKAGQYEFADVDALREQLRAPGWSRVVCLFK